jgi:hypothetical protein
MSNEIVPEVAVVDTPSVEEIVTPSETIETLPQPNTTVEPEAELSEEELDAAIEAILNDMPSSVVTEPTFFL